PRIPERGAAIASGGHRAWCQPGASAGYGGEPPVDAHRPLRGWSHESAFQPWGLPIIFRAMSLLSIAAILLCLAGLFAWVNQRYFQLPVTIGLMLLAMLNALALLMAKQFAPAWV